MRKNKGFVLCMSYTKIYLRRTYTTVQMCWQASTGEIRTEPSLAQTEFPSSGLKMRKWEQWENDFGVNLFLLE